MKKNIVFLLIIVFSFCLVNVDAKCDYKRQADLATEAANVKIKYEVATKTLKYPEIRCDREDADNANDESCTADIDYFKVYILNLSDNFILKATNNFNNETKTFTSQDADENGIINFDWMNVSTVTNFTFNLYASQASECYEEHLRTIYFTTPRKNLYSYYDLCDGHDDIYLCEKFVTTEELSFNEFYKEIKNLEKKEEEKEKENLSFFQKLINFIKNNKVLVICSGIGLVVIAVGVIIIVRKRNNKWNY